MPLFDTEEGRTGGPSSVSSVSFLSNPVEPAISIPGMKIAERTAVESSETPSRTLLCAGRSRFVAATVVPSPMTRRARSAWQVPVATTSSTRRPQRAQPVLRSRRARRAASLVAVTATRFVQGRLLRVLPRRARLSPFIGRLMGSSMRSSVRTLSCASSHRSTGENAV